MQPEPKDRLQPYIKSVQAIIDAMRAKERYVEEQNSEDYSDASRVIKEKLTAFESLYDSAKQAQNQNAMRLTDEQKKIFEKVIQDANLGIESHNLKVIRDSIRDLETFRERISGL